MPEVAAGGEHSCGIRGNGTLWCWGRNNYGQIGNGKTGADVPAPLQVGTLTDWAKVTGGGASTCAIRTNKALYCWGLNHRGQIGDQTRKVRATPTRVPGASTWRSVSMGFFHTCAIRTNKTLWCWGDNSAGQLGQGTTKQSLKRQQVPGKWSTVSAGRLDDLRHQDQRIALVLGPQPVRPARHRFVRRQVASHPGREVRRPGGRSRCPGPTPAAAPPAARCAAGDATRTGSSAPATPPAAPARRSSTGGHTAVSIGVAEGTSCLVDARGCPVVLGRQPLRTDRRRRQRHPDADSAGRDLLLGLGRLAARVRRQRRRVGLLGQQRARSARQRKADRHQGPAHLHPGPRTAAQPVLLPPGLVQRARQRPLPAVRPRRPLRPQPDAFGVDRAGADHGGHPRGGAAGDHRGTARRHPHRREGEVRLLPRPGEGRPQRRVLARVGHHAGSRPPAR